MRSRLLKQLLLFCVLFSLGTSVRASDWVTYKNCRLLANPANDGDSFHVRADGKEYIFRLYFVDTPETDDSLPDRVAEQAKYFGVNAKQTIEVGLSAERFTREKLARPFTVETRKEDARGRSHLPRYFAFVEMGNEDLAEDLVRNGLARVYGARGHPPDRAAPEAERHKLQQLERTAKTQKLGGWGVSSGRVNARAAATASPSPSAGANNFDAFFHPTATPTPIPLPGAVGSVPVSSTSAGGKLDINTASNAELDNLPGIGPVLAARIIAARPFKSADELGEVSGIGTKKFAKLRPYFQ